MSLEAQSKGMEPISPSSSDKDWNFFPSFSDDMIRLLECELQERYEWLPDEVDLASGSDGFSIRRISPSESIDWDLDSDSDSVASRVGVYYDPFDKEKPKWEFLKRMPVCKSIQKGKHLDVVSLLSTYGNRLVRIGPKKINCVKAKSLKGKYILLVCVFVPAKWDELNSYNLCLLSLLSSEFGKRSDFEMVMVAKMRQNWDNDVDAFNHFFSAFSGRLAVPFGDKNRRDYICKSLNFDGKVRAILVDPNRKVLQDNVDSIVAHGAAGFPFDDESLTALAYECHEPWQGNPRRSLAGLLSCDPSFHLRKFNSKETVSVEQLSKKLVGLYLFQLGDKLKAFQKVYQLCRKNNRDFEIVLVCLPFYESRHPKVFQDVVSLLLKKLDISWWAFPYQNSACLRLGHLAAEPVQDAMIIVGPDSEYVDHLGGAVINHFGMEAYPFTREVLVQTYLKKTGAVTLESLLRCKYLYRDHKYDKKHRRERVSVAKLQGKNVLLYVDFAVARDRYTYDKAVKWYTEIKEIDSDFELVFVFLTDKRVYSSVEVCGSEVTWLFRPFDPEHSQFLLNHDAFLGGSNGDTPIKGLGPRSVLAFGKDGRIHSLHPLVLLCRSGLNAYPFRGDLRYEIIDTISFQFQFMLDYY